MRNLDPVAYGLPGPIGTIFGIGRNYAQHAKELGNAVPENPIVFCKPLTALCPTGSRIWIPGEIGQVDHEVEVVACLGEGGRDIPVDQALRHVAGYAIGIDVTARALQERAKKQGHPWELCKGYDGFAPLGRFASAAEIGHGPFSFSLSVAGHVRQQGNTQAMIFSLSFLISYLSHRFTLRRGDLIFTGTPQGVGPIQPGDRLHAELAAGASFLEAEAVAHRPM